MEKIKIKNDTIYLKSQKGQILAEHEIEFINNKMQDFILPIDFEKRKKGKFNIFINTSGRLSLRNFLSVPVNKKSFANLLSNILKSLETMKKEYLNYHSCILDIDLVMLSSDYSSVIFPYIPIDDFDSGYTLRDFLMSILDCAIFYKDEDTNYINEYKRILYAQSNFSLFDLREYVEILANSIGVTKKGSSVCTNCQGNIPYGNAYCPFCGTNISKIPNAEKNNITSVINSLEKKDLKKLKKENDTSSVDAVMSLRRKITGEVIIIRKFPFYIGRDAVNDLVIDSKSISRRHAAINYENGSFYVYDNNTINHTYVNNIQINNGSKQEINDGKELSFADVSFVVIIK